MKSASGLSRGRFRDFRIRMRRAEQALELSRDISERRLTSNTTRRVVGQWGGAGGAICEDHFGVTERYEGRALADNNAW